MFTQLGAALRADTATQARLVALLGAAQTDRAAPLELEDMLYQDLPDGRDRHALTLFHSSAWEDRPALAARFYDPRHRAIARRLIYLERPDLLDEVTRAKMDEGMRARVLARSNIG